MKLNPKEILAAREWAIECVVAGMFADVEWDEADDFVAELSDARIERFVARYFDGGIAGFIENESLSA